MTQPCIYKNTNGDIVGDGVYGLLATALNVDLVSEATTNIITPAVGYVIIPDKLNYLCTAFTLANGDGGYTAGTNGADYDDYMGGGMIMNLTAIGDYEIATLMPARICEVTSADTFAFKVGTKDSGTALNVDIQVWGWIYKQ